MPVFKSAQGSAPPWCEMEYFEIVDLPAGATHTFRRLGRKEKLIVGQGKCHIGFAGQTVAAQDGANLDLTTADGEFQVQEVVWETTLIRMCGRWGHDTSGSGIFTVEKAGERQDCGDPVDYPKETGFDNHFHDCDEYWIVFQGSGIAVSEGKSYQLSPGDCIATRMGEHHDFPQIFEPVRAVYFETTMRGQKRPGHLWEHTHGPAQPAKDEL